MKLIIERSQREGGLINKKQVFVVKVQAEITDAEKDAINKYSLADNVLYESHEIIDPGSGLLGMASRMAMKSQIQSLIVRELVNGKTFECADIVEMKHIEAQIMEAAQVFKEIVDTAASFGGREVIEL